MGRRSEWPGWELWGSPASRAVGAKGAFQVRGTSPLAPATGCAGHKRPGFRLLAQRRGGEGTLCLTQGGPGRERGSTGEGGRPGAPRG